MFGYKKPTIGALLNAIKEKTSNYIAGYNAKKAAHRGEMDAERKKVLSEKLRAEEEEKKQKQEAFDKKCITVSGLITERYQIHLGTISSGGSDNFGMEIYASCCRIKQLDEKPISILLGEAGSTYTVRHNFAIGVGEEVTLKCVILDEEEMHTRWAKKSMPNFGSNYNRKAMIGLPQLVEIM